MSEDLSYQSVSSLKSRFEQLAAGKSDGSQSPPTPKAHEDQRSKPGRTFSATERTDDTRLIPPRRPPSRSPSPRPPPPVAQSVPVANGQKDQNSIQSRKKDDNSPFITPPDGVQLKSENEGHMQLSPPDASVERTRNATEPVSSKSRRNPSYSESTPSRQGRSRQITTESDTESPPSLPPRPEPGPAMKDHRASMVRHRSHSPGWRVHDQVPLESLSERPTGRGFASNSLLMPSTTVNSDIATDDTMDDSDDQSSPTDEQAITDFPDSSQVNRRRPYFSKAGIPKEIEVKHDTRKWNVCGNYLCISTAVKQNTVTRVWSIKANEMLWSLQHENARVTAIAFKPSQDVDKDGRVLWLGTKEGHLWEIDISKPDIVERRTNAHTGAIVAIHRCFSDIWSLDESGKLQVWSGHGVTPSLKDSPRTFRIPGKHSFSMVVGDLLWVATGRQVYMYKPTYEPGTAFNVAGRPMIPTKPCGNITSGAVIKTAANKVFFSHEDGKISIFSTQEMKCVDVVNVSNYNIIGIAGVGRNLWAAYKTGMVYVYDTRVRPWRVMKDWKAHEGAIQDIICDMSSIWKTGRLQVLTMGSDNRARIWDGMLMDDWFENELQDSVSEFCQFRDMKALVCTWNAGASKPSDLSRSPEDSLFLDNLLREAELPDIVVFGFQELVELDGKRLTAKSMLTSGKKKKEVVSKAQEHMSQQYRIWQERLVKAIKIAAPKEPYTLIHSANLVGLYTCIFIRSVHQPSVRDVCTSTIKTGLAGLHGNKGAVVIRFLLDDSSLCFVNCHLAAGQTGTIHRNNDLAKILQSESLAGSSEANQNDYFVGGGDGSMILDHEICILNGDLNYRIDLPREHVMERIRRQDLEKLLEHDQLLVQRKKNSGFRLSSFSEPSITFAPTYKYNVGSDDYDTSEKRRTPAWCDRIYYRGSIRVSPSKYMRHNVKVSDHRPVTCLFSLRLKTVKPEVKKQVWDNLAHRWLQVAQDAVNEAKSDYLVACGFDEVKARKTLDAFPKVRDAALELRRA